MPRRGAIVVRRADGVRLQRVRWADREAYLAATRRSRGQHRPWVFPPTTEISYRRWIDELATGRHERFLLLRDADDALLGYFAINGISMGSFRCGFLGYWVSSAHLGRGYGSLGLRLLLDHAFVRLRLNRVEANIQPQNDRSIALASRLGFRKEGFSPRYLEIDGVWCDHERWAITRDEWLHPTRDAKKPHSACTE
jgi:[ribosomal protein S5]-alanine N-acetyltransferase